MSHFILDCGRSIKRCKATEELGWAHSLTSANTPTAAELSSSSRIICLSEHKRVGGNSWKEINQFTHASQKHPSALMESSYGNHDHSLTAREILTQHECFVGISAPSYWIYLGSAQLCCKALHLHQFQEERSNEQEVCGWKGEEHQQPTKYIHSCLAWEESLIW